MRCDRFTSILTTTALASTISQPFHSTLTSYLTSKHSRQANQPGLHTAVASLFGANETESIVPARYPHPFMTRPQQNTPDLGRNAGETRSTCSAAAGTFLVEFGALSRLTGDASFEAAARRAVGALWERRSPLGLVGGGVKGTTGQWESRAASIGAGTDRCG